MLETRGAPILNPVTGAEHRVRIEQPNGFEFTIAEIGRGWSKAEGPLSFELSDTYGQSANIHLCQSGVVCAGTLLGDERDDGAARACDRRRLAHHRWRPSADAPERKLPDSLPLARRLPRHALAAARWVHGAWGSPMAYCVGCCAALMLLLFAGGVMNLVWIAGLSLLVLAEKSLPRGERLSVALGVLMLIAGTGLIASAVVD